MEKFPSTSTSIWVRRKQSSASKSEISERKSAFRSRLSDRRLAFEFVNKSCGLAKPFEPLLRSKPMKLGVTVEILWRALRKYAFEFGRRFDFSLAIFHGASAIFPAL